MLLLMFGGASGLATTSTRRIQLPINCVLAEDAQYKALKQTFEKLPGREGIIPVAKVSPLSRLSKQGSSFTVKTGKKGYD